MFGLNKNQKADMELFTVFDNKTSSYRLPMFALNSYDMIRQLESMFEDTPQNQAQNPLCTHPDDYSIIKIGTYSKSTGHIETQSHEHVINLRELASQVAAKQPTQAQLVKQLTETFERVKTKMGIV